MITPRYASLFLERYCPRNCSYCKARLVKTGRLLKVEEWIKAFDILRSEGVEFFLILGNDVLLYPEIVDLVKMLKENGFYRKYAMYSTFPEPWYSMLREELVDAGLYNISCGVDILTMGLGSISEKSIWGLEQLKWFKAKGVEDVHATITIHNENYKYMEEICEICTRYGIWMAVSLVEYSKDGKHDFFGRREDLGYFLIKNKLEFKEYMYKLAKMVEEGKWTMQTVPDYFRMIGDLGGEPDWHCSYPLIISIEADGSLRLCAYRPFYKHKASIFDIGKKISMEDYAKWYMEESKECPGCCWSYPYLAEYWYIRDVNFGDKVLQVHASKYYRGDKKWG
jgi:molybdenum cofactor biosynthesis enzyme MoaA